MWTLAGRSAPELRQQRLHRIGDRHRVGRRLALDAERDGARLAFLRVEPRGRSADPRHRRRSTRTRSRRTGAPFRSVTTISLYSLGVHQLTAGLQRERPVQAGEGPPRHVDVPVLQLRLDLVDPDLPRGERVGIELGVDRCISGCRAPAPARRRSPFGCAARSGYHVSSSIQGGSVVDVMTR